MMPAEKWYEYQTNYKKYGFDMKPAKQPVEKPKAKSSVTPKDRLMMLALAMVAGIICVLLIINAAYAASVKYEINQYIKANEVLTGEIENLSVKINQANNLSAIEQVATTELGMVYPDPNEFIYIQPDQEPVKDFALLLKEEAYN